MAMPEAAVNENYLFAGWEYEVGVAGKSRSVKSEAVSHFVDETSDLQLGATALVLDAPHSFAAFGRAPCAGADWGAGGGGQATFVAGPVAALSFNLQPSMMYGSVSSLCGSAR